MSVGQSLDLSHIFESEHRTASEIANLWSEWDSARAVWKKRVAETKAYVFATSTRETTNVQNPWSHSTNLAKITQIYDNLRANYMTSLLPNPDWFKFEGEDREAVTFKKRRNIESYLKTKHRIDNFHTVVGELLDDWVLTGNAFAYVTYVNETHADPDTGLPIMNYTGPRTVRISPNDIVFNPAAATFESSPKIIRTIKTIGEIERDVEENPEMQYEQEILDNVIKMRRDLTQYSTEDVDKSIQMEFDGFGTFGQYMKSGYVEMLDFYGDIYDHETQTFYKNYVITVVDRKWVIRKQPLNTWTGRPHIYHSPWRRRPDNLWGMGPLDNLVGLQYRINHLENARADAFDQMINPDIVYQGDVNEYEGPNGGMVYEVNEAGNVRYLAPDTSVLNADFQINTLEQRMELYAGAPSEAMGIRSPGEKTAFEVQQLQNASSRIFQNKINDFEMNMLEKILNAQIEAARRNLNMADIIKIVDKNTGVEDFMSITREDLVANGKLTPVGARHFARKAQLAQEMSQFQQMVMSDPMVAQHFPSVKVAEMWEEILGFDKFGIFEPYSRIAEQAEAQRMMQIAQQQLEEEQMMVAQESEMGAMDEEVQF